MAARRSPERACRLVRRVPHRSRSPRSRRAAGVGDATEVALPTRRSSPAAGHRRLGGDEQGGRLEATRRGYGLGEKREEGAKGGHGTYTLGAVRRARCGPPSRRNLREPLAPARVARLPAEVALRLRVRGAA